MNSRYPRYSSILPDAIEYSLWLAFSQDGDVSMTRGEPKLSPNQRAMRLSIKVPKAVFVTPSITAKIEIPNPGVDDSGRITAVVRQAAEKSLKEVFGVDVVLEVRPPT